jgi:hypothetical protein
MRFGWNGMILQGSTHTGFVEPDRCKQPQPDVACGVGVSSHDYPTFRSLAPYRATPLVIDANQSADATSSQKFAQTIFPSSENYAYCNDLVHLKTRIPDRRMNVHTVLRLILKKGGKITHSSIQIFKMLGRSL